MKSFILFTVSAVLLGLLLVPFNNKNNDGVAVVCALDVKRILHQTMSTSSKEHQQQHEMHEKHDKQEKHIHHSKKAPGWEKALKKDSKSKSKSTNSKSVKSKLVKSKSTKSKSTTYAPTKTPTNAPTNAPTNVPTDSPTRVPTNAPTNTPTNAPTNTPTNAPTNVPTNAPTNTPTNVPTNVPTNAPTNTPTNAPTHTPTIAPTDSPSDAPTKEEQSIAEIICDLDNADVFELLCEALRETDLLQMLDDQGGDTYTLFAPNNSAISKLNADKADAMQQILLTHMLVGEVSYNELVYDTSYIMVNNQPTTTRKKQPLTSKGTLRKKQVGEGNGSANSPIISLSNIDIQATNGIIHEINRVIFPDLK